MAVCSEIAKSSQSDVLTPSHIYVGTVRKERVKLTPHTVEGSAQPMHDRVKGLLINYVTFFGQFQPYVTVYIY